MDKFFITLAFLIPLFLMISGKEKLAIGIVVFFIPYNLIDIKGIGINYFFLFGAVIGNMCKILIRKNRIPQSEIEYNKYIYFFYGLFILSTIMIFVKDTTNQITVYHDNEKIDSSILFTICFISGLSFFKLIIVHIKSINDSISLFLAFVASTILLFLSWLNFQFNIYMPSFLLRKVSGGDWNRFSGFWGDYELTNEYLFIIAVICIIILFHKRINLFFRVTSFSLFCISFIIAVTTGTRSLLVMILVFILIITSVTLFSSNIKFYTKILLYLLISIFIAFLYLSIISSDILGQRVLASINIFNSTANFDFNAFQLLINRNYTDTYQDIIKIGGIFGIGPLFVEAAGHSMWRSMVYHCLYYHIFLSFGLVGFILFTSFYFSIIKNLYKEMVKEKTLLLNLLFSIIVTLFFDQIKINYLREPSHMITYWFLLGIVTAVSKKDFLNEQNKYEN